MYMRLQQLAASLDSLAETTGRIIAWLTLAMVLLTTIIVVLRYVFDTGFIWMQESVTWMHAMVFMLGAAYALHHEERHLVSNFLGTSDMRIDIGASINLRPRDTVLVASDGLMDNVHLEEIIAHIRKGPADAGVDAVVELARKRMLSNNGKEPSKPDDLSLIVFRKRPRARRKTGGKS